MAMYHFVSWPCIALQRGIASPCIVALYRLASWHCIALNSGCIAKYRGLLFSHHLAPNLIVVFASPIVSGLRSDPSFDNGLILGPPNDWLLVPRYSSWWIPNGNSSLVRHNLPDPERGSPMDRKLWHTGTDVPHGACLFVYSTQ